MTRDSRALAVSRFPILAALTLGSGAALVVAILLDVPLGSALLAFAAVAVPALAWRICQFPASLRRRLARLVRAGLVIGACATASYDASRWLLVMAMSMDFDPFGALPFFGWGIAGTHLTPRAAFAVGAVYHAVNGVSFALSYCLLLGGRRWIWGIAWALSLELAMFSLYPGWLDLKAVMAEFTTVSLTGHVAYGATLGVLSERWVPRSGLRSEVR